MERENQGANRGTLAPLKPLPSLRGKRPPLSDPEGVTSPTGEATSLSEAT